MAISIYFLFGAGLGDDVTRGMSALDPLSPGGEDVSTLSQDSESDLLPDSSGDEASLDGDSDSDSGDSLVPYSFEPTESNSDSDGDGSDSDDDERLSSLTW